MTKFSKLLPLVALIISALFAFTYSSNATEEIPGSFTTTGELQTPEITVLGLYNSAGSLVVPTDYVTPNTKHSIRFELTNTTYAFDDMIITVAFFESVDGSREDFDLARTGIDGSAFVATFGYTEGARQDLRLKYLNAYTNDDMSWDDNYFNAGLDTINFDPTDNSFEFALYFNMSKVANAYGQYYIGVYASQGIPGQQDRFGTYAVEGEYYVNDYIEFGLQASTLEWTLAAGETFLDFNYSSASSVATIPGDNFSFIANVDYFLNMYADTQWRADDPDNPGEFLFADLVDTPTLAQEFAIRVDDSNNYLNGAQLKGISDNITYYYQTNEIGTNAFTYYFWLYVSRENFQDGSYEGSIFIEIWSEKTGLI